MEVENYVYQAPMSPLRSYRRKILLNGIDIRKYNYKEYMMIFSVVFQDFKLFSLTLGENVSTKINYDEEEVKNALKKSGFYNWLSTMQKVTEYLSLQGFQ